jgi:hypothetical protein
MLILHRNIIIISHCNIALKLITKNTNIELILSTLYEQTGYIPMTRIYQYKNTGIKRQSGIRALLASPKVSVYLESGDKIELYGF